MNGHCLHPLRRPPALLLIACLLPAVQAARAGDQPSPPSAPTAAGPPAQPRPGPSSLVDLALSVRERVRLQAQAERARERLKVLAREADSLATRQQTVLGDLRRFELERERHATEEEAARAAGTLARAALADTTRKLEALTEAVAARAPLVEARLTRLYKVGPLDAPRYWVRADGLVQTARAWRLLAAVASHDRDLLAAAARDRAELAALGDEQRQRAADADGLARAAQEARAAAARAVAARQALVERLDRERDLAARLVGELQAAETRVRDLLAVPPGAAPATAAGAADQPPALLPLAPFKGDLDWPVEGRVLSRFGRERQSRFGTVLPRNGLEIGAAESTPVQAPHEGRVVFADDFAGLGRLVIVDHGGQAFSLYGHLGEIAVKRGDLVARGARLGSVGRTPAGTEALYFELRIDGQPVDPLEWIKPVSARRPRP